MARRPIPPIAWLLAGGTALALTALAIAKLRSPGLNSFFLEGDASFYRAVARDPFGTGHAFARAGFTGEIPYRYGRIGYPLLAWVLALGRPRLVPWSLIIVQFAATATIPGLACVLADEYGAAPAVGPCRLVSPLLLILGIVFAEPLLAAVVLLAFVLEARQRHRSALVAFAFAILVKETAVLALIPFIWRELKRRDLGKVAEYASAVVPYLLWCIVVRIRIGEIPFLAKTLSRTLALNWPGVGMHRIYVERTRDYGAVIAIVVATFALCCAGAFLARRLPIAAFTAALAILVVCLGWNALRFSEETLRLLTVPQVFGSLCLAVAIAQRATPSSGARN